MPDLKILHLIPNFTKPTGGPSKVVADLVESMSEIGCESTIVSVVDRDESLFPVKRGCAKIEVAERSGPSIYSFSFELKNLLEKEVPKHDLVVVHSLHTYQNAVFRKVCRRHNKPYVMMPHGSLRHIIREGKKIRKFIVDLLYEKKNLRCAAALQFTATDESREADRYVSNPNRIVLPLGIRTEDYVCNDSQSQIELDSSQPPIILFMSRLAEIKGLEFLIDACEHFPYDTEYELHIAGEGAANYVQALKNRAEKSPARDKIHFLGGVYGSDKIRLLNRARVFCLPTFSENFGIAIIEAMASGCPVVTTKGAMIWKEVQAGGGVISSQEPGAIASAILPFLIDEEVQGKRSVQAREFAKNAWDIKKIAQALKEQYQIYITS